MKGYEFVRRNNGRTLTCTACGTVLGIPKKGMPKDGLSCNWCGYVNVAVPEEAPKASVAPAKSPPLPVAAFAETTSPTTVPKAATHRWADDEDDNGQPYDLPQEEIKTRPCAACGKKIDLKAVVCVHCGFDADRGQEGPANLSARRPRMAIGLAA